MVTSLRTRFIMRPRVGRRTASVDVTRDAEGSMYHFDRKAGALYVALSALPTGVDAESVVASAVCAVLSYNGPTIQNELPIAAMLRAGVSQVTFKSQGVTLEPSPHPSPNYNTQIGNVLRSLRIGSGDEVGDEASGGVVTEASPEVALARGQPGSRLTPGDVKRVVLRPTHQFREGEVVAWEDEVMPTTTQSSWLRVQHS